MCNAEGSEDNTCDENGKCFCNTNVVGDKCDQCNAGFVEFPACDQCAAEHFGENCQGKDLSRVKAGFKSVPLHHYFEFPATLQHWLAQRFQNKIEDERL